MIRCLISSHVRYAPVTLPQLLPSLRNQFAPEEIVVVIGGAAAVVEGLHDEVQTLWVTHNSFDYTAPIAVLEYGLRGDHWFWLHDTCRAGPRFRMLLEAAFDPEALIIGAGWHSLGMPFANLGLYSQAAFETAREGLLALKNCTKLAACNGDGVVWRANEGTGRRLLFGDGAVKGDVVRDEYGTGVVRKTSYLPDIDLYKIQANWGQGGEFIHP